MKKNRKAEYRVFLGISDIAGYMHSLHKGFGKINVKSDFYDLTGTKFNYFEENSSVFIQWHRNLVAHEAGTNSKILRFLFSFSQVTLRCILFIKAVFFYDVFIFCSFRTILHFYDLPLLKLFNKKIIFVFFGTDTRPAYISGNLISSNVMVNDNPDNLEFIYANCLEKKKLISKVEKYSDFIVNHPPTSLFHSKPFILWSVLGFPFWKGKMKLESTQKDDIKQVIRILHAPSNPLTKGSYIIEEAIANLKLKGYPIDFVKITNRPNKEVLSEISKCDLVIDELYSDIPLGGLGTEAAFFGKPTINGGYYFEEIKKDLPASAIPPSVFCSPEDIEAEIEKLITDTDLRKKIGRASKEFVDNNWEAGKVAGKYLQLFNEDFPEDWYFDPFEIRYILGYGQSKSQLTRVIKALLAKYGDEGLFLEDKPFLVMKYHDLLLHPSNELIVENA
jgi:glycosyltransferase involved in cell wall biosynthesis